jgi:hypothetical protein|uniref:Uncharacterized protein n=1 Tax=Zea mays TaxID=4577 RepID=B4FF94_MAIZE|nr:unknown [Zea mays]
MVAKLFWRARKRPLRFGFCKWFKAVNEKGGSCKLKRRITKVDFVTGVLGSVAIVLVISFGTEQA